MMAKKGAQRKQSQLRKGKITINVLRDEKRYYIHKVSRRCYKKRIQRKRSAWNLK